ncbi:aldehyde dehydrogenase family protein [Francisellaceae bacterium]|nr:aldehyde dehydrogenase family protein [Francisellaceae bacterium]
MKIMNPSTGELIRVIENDNNSSINQKLVTLEEGQSKWVEQTTIHQRIACIEKFIELLKENIDSLSRDLTAEVGKPFQESRNEINAACYRCQFFIDESVKLLDEQEVHIDGNTRERLAYEPLGVIANISAWNYPYLVGVNVFIPALISGNAVAYKPSEFAVLTGLNIQNYLYQSGIPKNVFQSFIGAKEVGEALLKASLDGYFFTGSVATGKHIAKKVAEKLVPVGLELGGKDPVYVAEDVKSVRATAEALVDGVFYNNGQSCCSVERIYVHKSIYDKFVSHFVNMVNELKVGDPNVDGITNGAITRPQHVDFLRSQVKDAEHKGAILMLGGHAKDSKGSFFEPTVLINVDHSMRVMTEESFGPIIGIQSVNDDKEAIMKMNDTEFGLTASVFTNDEDRANQMMRKLDAGNVYWNCCDRVSPYLPWAGRKNSGLGVTLSKHGVYAFVKTKGLHFRKI